MCVGACAVNILFDQEQLLGLVSNLYLLTGMAANILDPQGRDINLFGSHPPFCRAMNDLPEGHRRCVACDAWKVKNYSAARGFQFYRCHAGICVGKGLKYVKIVYIVGVFREL